jgi:hypothetical protein
MMCSYHNNIILLVGSSMKEFPLSCFFLQSSLSRDFASIYILVFSAVLFTCLYGALLELISPAAPIIIIVMYSHLWLVGIFFQLYSVHRHVVYIGWHTYIFLFEFLSLQLEVVSCHVTACL